VSPELAGESPTMVVDLACVHHCCNSPGILPSVLKQTHVLGKECLPSIHLPTLGRLCLSHRTQIRTCRTHLLPWTNCLKYSASAFSVLCPSLLLKSSKVFTVCEICDFIISFVQMHANAKFTLPKCVKNLLVLFHI